MSAYSSQHVRFPLIPSGLLRKAGKSNKLGHQRGVGPCFGMNLAPLDVNGLACCSEHLGPILRHPWLRVDLVPNDHLEGLIGLEPLRDVDHGRQDGGRGHL